MASASLESIGNISVLGSLDLSAIFDVMDTSSPPDLEFVEHSLHFPPPYMVTPS